MNFWNVFPFAIFRGLQEPVRQHILTVPHEPLAANSKVAVLELNASDGRVDTSSKIIEPIQSRCALVCFSDYQSKRFLAVLLWWSSKLRRYDSCHIALDKENMWI
ncbi:hypothetical protein NE237_011816 [Protea cynaroides]|uniref:Uncharacterized protein n=1 Tax=Protea cynaroides TaxID=273540 RepID=A0A9Q0GWC8_9MAGN|nr:hypothetical protein NE237_011816 [Protea cynaroides]